MDERELERLEINEDSVVYIAEGEVGGRRNVIKVGGMPRRKHQVLPSPTPSSGVVEGLGSRTSSSSMGSTEENTLESVSSGSGSMNSADASVATEGRAMWALQILDPEEAQAWIAAIKSAVLSQRYATRISTRIYAHY